MKTVSLMATAFAAFTALALTHSAMADMPKINTQPGKWSYTTRTEIPGLGSIPMSFEQCLTQKDIDEGRNLSAQKDAGVDCKYSDVKQSGNRYQFTATCKMKDVPEPMVMSYDMTATATQMEAKMVMTGGTAKAMGGKVNMSMSSKRLGGC